MGFKNAPENGSPHPEGKLYKRILFPSSAKNEVKKGHRYGEYLIKSTNTARKMRGVSQNVFSSSEKLYAGRLKICLLCKRLMHKKSITNQCESHIPQQEDAIWRANR